MYNTPFGWNLWDDTVRVKDLEEWLDELKDELELTKDKYAQHQSIGAGEAVSMLESDIEELEDFLDEVSCYRADDYLINESHWSDYVRGYVSDMVPDMSSSDWPACHMTMDWDAVEGEMLMDYAEARIGGETFYFRA